MYLSIALPALYAVSSYLYNKHKQLHKPITPSYIQGRLTVLITGVTQDNMKKLMDLSLYASIEEIIALSTKFNIHEGYSLKNFISEYGIDNTKQVMRAIISQEDITKLLPNPIRLPYHSLPHNKFIIVGVTLASITSYVFEAYNQASNLSNIFQIKALERRASIDEASKITTSYALSAFETGKASADQASNFSNIFQIIALTKLDSVDDALKIDNYHALEALKTGKVSVDDALKITNDYTLAALKTGKASANQALDFSNYYQILALEEGASVEEALKINNYLALDAFKPGKTNDNQEDLRGENARTENEYS